MAGSSTKTRRHRRNLRNRPREAKKQTLTESESSNKTLQGCRNWIDLPDDVTASILSRLPMFDILETAQRVCLTWRRICKDPMTWLTIRLEFDIQLSQQKIDDENFTSDKSICANSITSTHIRCATTPFILTLAISCISAPRTVAQMSSLSI
ncbi:hypothetical protein ACLB2K_028234 [Fragaria x ananassa]